MSGFFRKRVLDNIEINFLNSYYTQNGDHAAVTGGIGTEKLKDYASDIQVTIPIKDNQILSINATISAYTSASSSNLNPFTGASRGDDDDDDLKKRTTASPKGTPWAASTGASRKDTWKNVNVGYQYYSRDRNTIYSLNTGYAMEFDYRSFGGQLGLTRLWNQKNTEFSVKLQVFFDLWKPQYPTEIKTFVDKHGNLDAGFFRDVDILNQNGQIIDKFSPEAWAPRYSTLITKKNRNTYTLSLGLYQILNNTTQIGIFSDLTYQSGWLANPMQRVYFADRPNFYIGNPVTIPFYSSKENKDVFQLADDIERLPLSRFKIPIGTRLNYYFSEWLVLRAYYRYYTDNWDIHSHTADAEIALKIIPSFTLYPHYRFYHQTAAKYFAPYEQLLSTQQFYTSDYDLSRFYAHQYGMGFQYSNIFAQSHFLIPGLKHLTLDYNYYRRSNGLSAHIVSFGIILIVDPSLR